MRKIIPLGDYFMCYNIKYIKFITRITIKSSLLYDTCKNFHIFLGMEQKFYFSSNKILQKIPCSEN